MASPSIGLVGLGRMGGNMARRLKDKGGHEVVGWARSPETRNAAAEKGVAVVETLDKLIEAFPEGTRRVIWVMVPSGKATRDTVKALVDLLNEGDVIVDGGNSNFKETKALAAEVNATGVRFVDSGTSGGVWGYDVGYCQMVGGAKDAIDEIAPALTALAPADGWLHCGPNGSGHFVKMVHNGIEYGLMQAYAEGFEILNASEFELDERAIAHLWMQGSVVRSWLLELIGRAYDDDPQMESITGWVDDSGEGRWTVVESIETSVPAPVIALSLMMRFRSRQADTYSGKLLAAMRNQFGGHAVKKAGG